MKSAPLFLALVLAVLASRDTVVAQGTCGTWLCQTNGPRLGGFTAHDRIGAIQSVTLASGEAIALEPRSASPGQREKCPGPTGGGCGLNGPRLTGLTSGDEGGEIQAVTLASGERIALRR